MDERILKEIEKLQNNLQTIRKVAGWTTEELGERIGVTKQTISNLENKITRMTKTQYIAIRAVLDYEVMRNPESEALAKVIEVLLNKEDEEDEVSTFERSVPSSVIVSSYKRSKELEKTEGISTFAGLVAVAATGWLAKIITSDRKK